MRIKERDPDTGELKEEFKEVDENKPTKSIAELQQQIIDLTVTLGDYMLL